MSGPDSSWQVSVVGAGTMGHGIAYVAALAGCTVTLTDARSEALEQARSKIESLLAGGLKRGKLTEEDRAAVHSRLNIEADLATAVHRADVVIEAVVEQIGVKQQLFADLERHAPETALLATNTSSLAVGQIAAAAQGAVAADRDALLQSRSHHEAGRDRDTRTHRRAAGRARYGPGAAIRQGADRGAGFARLRLEPARSGAGSRSHADAGARRGHGGGHRQGDGAGLQPPHGARSSSPTWWVSMCGSRSPPISTRRWGWPTSPRPRS